jgi:hypothetical protein
VRRRPRTGGGCTVRNVGWRTIEACSLPRLPPHETRQAPAFAAIALCG